MLCGLGLFPSRLKGGSREELAGGLKGRCCCVGS